ncbi:unnamed protein product [Rotaria sordida]|uniref:Uncharacterized protein n=1 Tax=Rotaria sordida TaxID=392033 RepID=A0A815H1W1_9BILA|nr:unnamed protein product [Rotaria sordida]
MGKFEIGQNLRDTHYYFKVKNFFDPYIKQNAPKHLQHVWFSSPGFAFYGVQRELLVGSYSSLIASLDIALFVLFLTSGNLFIAIYALITITFVIAVSVAIFAALKWELGIVEAIIIIMSVSLSILIMNEKKIKQHYSSSISTPTESPDNMEIRIPCKMSTYHLIYKQQQIERETRVTESISRVGSAVFMAAFTTFAARFSMTLSSLTAFRQMGQFLMTIMLTSWVFSMFFFLPLCA